MHATSGAPAVVSSELGGSALDSMRRARDAHRRVEAQAIAATEAALRGGDESAARNASTAGGIASDKALALDRAIVAAEEGEQQEAARLTDEAVELQRGVLEALFRALGVPVPAVLLGELAARAAVGAPLVVGEAVARDAYEVMASALREGMRGEVEALFGGLGVSAGVWEEMAERLVAGEAVPAEVMRRFHGCLLADATVARGERLRAVPDEESEPPPRVPRQEGPATVKRVAPGRQGRGRRLSAAEVVRGGRG